ncbi:hypothetical protein D1872_223350 [compost metagenome]
MKQVPFSVQEEMELIAQELRRHFSPSQLEQLARQTGFVQRKSKYTAQDLVSLCVFLNEDISITPLTRLCGQLDASHHLSMSAEGLNQRFNSSAVAFLQALFSTPLQKKSWLHPLFLVNLIHILIVSVFLIPPFFNFQTYTLIGIKDLWGTTEIRVKMGYRLTFISIIYKVVSKKHEFCTLSDFSRKKSRSPVHGKLAFFSFCQNNLL